jgi:hypothetical protein
MCGAHDAPYENALVGQRVRKDSHPVAHPLGGDEAEKLGRRIERAKIQTGEFDPGSERTFAAGLTHASRTGWQQPVAHGCVTRR